MKKTSLAIPAGILALFLGGCPSSKPPEQAVQPSPVPTPSPQASPSSPPTFEPVLQPRTTPTTPQVTGLIRATDPDQQRVTVKKGRSDPFAMLPVQPIVKFPNTANVPTLVRRPSRLGVPALPSRPARPAPPQPNEALAVVVTGVMDLPTSPVAIVKAPGESVARRVGAGATLSNGQVRVKAIYAGSSNPIVILEQYGIEVTRRVGEGAEVASAPGAV